MNNNNEKINWMANKVLKSCNNITFLNFLYSERVFYKFLKKVVSCKHYLTKVVVSERALYTKMVGFGHLMQWSTLYLGKEWQHHRQEAFFWYYLCTCVQKHSANEQRMSEWEDLAVSDGGKKPGGSTEEKEALGCPQRYVPDARHRPGMIYALGICGTSKYICSRPVLLHDSWTYMT